VTVLLLDYRLIGAVVLVLVLGSVVLGSLALDALAARRRGGR